MYFVICNKVSIVSVCSIFKLLHAPSSRRNTFVFLLNFKCGESVLCKNRPYSALYSLYLLYIIVFKFSNIIYYVSCWNAIPMKCKVRSFRDFFLRRRAAKFRSVLGTNGLYDNRNLHSTTPLWDGAKVFAVSSKDNTNLVACLRQASGTEVLRTYSKLDFQEIMIMVLGNNIYIGNIYIEVYILMIKVQ